MVSGVERGNGENPPVSARAQIRAALNSLNPNDCFGVVSAYVYC
jgi:hypothetical protein